MFSSILQAGVTQLMTALLLSTAPVPAEPTKPASVGTSMYVTRDNMIRLSLEKTGQAAVTVLLRGPNKAIMYQRTVGKKLQRAAFRFDISNLADGTYDIEVRASDGSLHHPVQLSTPGSQPVRTISMQAPKPFVPTDGPLAER